MKKLTVFAHKNDTDEIVKRLVKLRCVEIRSAEADCHLERLNCDVRRNELEASVSDINEAMATLNKYSKRTRSLVNPKLKVNLDKFVKNGFADNARFAVEQTLTSVARQNEIKAEQSKLDAAILSASPYVSLELPLGFVGTATTSLLLGALPADTDVDAIGRELYEAGAVFEQVSESPEGRFISVIVHQGDANTAATILSSYGFIRANFNGIDKTASEYISEAKAKKTALEKEYNAIGERFFSLAESLGSVEILYDIEQTTLNETIEKQKLLSTDTTGMIFGWIPEAREGSAKALLEKYCCAYELEAPTEEDKPPILLKNNGFAANFEWVLGMYSYPTYGRFDPTFIMSIFYFIIFGIMFADAGYGLVLMLACFLGVKLLKVGEGMKRFLLMFGYCGISCVIFGVLFGAYFGDFPLAFMRNILGMTEAELPNLALLGSTGANLAVLFDPLQNPMGFLIFSLAVGAIHLIAGMAVKFVILCRDGQVLDAVLDIGAYWLLFAGFGLLALFPSVGLWVTLAAVAVIVLTHGRAEKNIVMKLLKGLLGLYDLISYVSDLLSYSRILALGLAAGVIAQVVNILATMGGPTIVGFIALVLAFLLGHLLNIAINVLGTFVHTSRLQYIEFFGKFYEDGGVAFEPAEPSDKYTEEE